MELPIKCWHFSVVIKSQTAWGPILAPLLTNDTTWSSQRARLCLSFSLGNPSPSSVDSVR